MRRILKDNRRSNDAYILLKNFITSFEAVDSVDEIELIKAYQRLLRNYEEIPDLSLIASKLEILGNKVLFAKETLVALEAKREGSVQPQNDLVFSPREAGEYIAQKVERATPVSKAQVNNYIREGRLKSFKQGRYNQIYQYDLDEFIELYGNTLRSI